ncbi:hypothetical protein CDS [Bradyrhizobium sp.]|nr:hypothetical protein CDS [Bradyrhizobium sp.]
MARLTGVRARTVRSRNRLLWTHASLRFRTRAAIANDPIFRSIPWPMSRNV